MLITYDDPDGTPIEKHQGDLDERSVMLLVSTPNPMPCAPAGITDAAAA